VTIPIAIVGKIASDQHVAAILSSDRFRLAGAARPCFPPGATRDRCIPLPASEITSCAFGGHRSIVSTSRRQVAAT